MRLKLPAYLREVRRASSSKFLGVMIDADTGTVLARRQQLDESCESEQERAAAAADPAVVLIPRRHIETWIEFFGTGQASETTDYKHAYDDKIAAVARRFAQELDNWLVQPASSPVPASLAAAQGELLRFRDAAKS